MIIPPIEKIEFSPLLWKEFLIASSKWKTIKEFYPFLKEKAKLQDWCNRIEMDVQNERIAKLINGYITIDLLYDCEEIELSKFKLWQLFEDLVEEIFREALKRKEECTVVKVDKMIRGIDFVITNPLGDKDPEIIDYMKLNGFKQVNKNVEASVKMMGKEAVDQLKIAEGLNPIEVGAAKLLSGWKSDGITDRNLAYSLEGSAVITANNFVDGQILTLVDSSSYAFVLTINTSGTTADDIFINWAKRGL